MQPRVLSVLSVLSIVWIAPALVAQSVILGSSTARTVRIQGPQVHSLASAGDGSLWTLLTNTDGVANTSDHALTSSTDGGKTWKGLYYLTTTNQAAAAHQDGAGAIYIGDDCHTLHVVWVDKLTDGFRHLVYQTFDTLTKKWNGTATVLQKGTATIKWYAHDISVTPRGTVIIGASSGARGGPGFTGSSTLVFVRKLGQSAFSAPIKVNKYTTKAVDVGRAPSLHVQGEVVHIIYRTKRSGTSTALNWGFSYRALDTQTLKFAHAADVHIGPSDNLGVNGGLFKATALDQSGNLYVLYASPGVLRLAYGPAGKTSTNAGWQNTTIAIDKNLLGGNSPASAYQHFGLSTSSNDVVELVYSKLADTHKTLYIQTYRLGQPLIKPPANNERVLHATTVSNSFMKVNGYADVRKVSGWMAITSGLAGGTATIARFYSNGNRARSVQFGVSCSGNLTAAPGLRSLNPPLLGQNYDLMFERIPATSIFFMGVDLKCLAAPLHLVPMGAPGCYLYGSLMIPIGAFKPLPNGTLKLTTKLPANQTFVGAHVIVQTVILANGVNAAGLLTTNSLGVYF